MPFNYIARAIALLIVCAAGAPSLAQTSATGFPQRPIKIVVPFAAGGNADIVARLMGSAMAELGQPFVIENKTGGGSTIASEFVARAPADGYTLLLTSIAHAVNPALFAKLAFDPVKDFQPVVLVNHVPELLVINPRLGVKDLAGFLALLRAEPGKHTYGSGGNGSAEQLAAELFKHLAKVDAVHVPYRGGSAGINDLIAGQISFMITPMSGAIQHVQGGTLVGVAGSTAKRVPVLPDLPAIGEAGPGYEAYTWNAIFAPARTPRPIV